MTTSGHPPKTVDNPQAVAWLLTDMALNAGTLSVVKAMGLDYPVGQLVLIRALVGLVLILPWIWRRRDAFRGLTRLRLQAARVVLSCVTLGSSYYAVARLPFALFTAINFTRPILLMALAALLLGERVTRLRWIVATIGLAGALIAVGPIDPAAGPGLLALLVTVTGGTLAIILTRQLRGTPTVVMMAFYTAGLAVGALPFALATWQPVTGADLPGLLAIGVFAQCGQTCFLKAHFTGDAGVLGPVSYASILFATAAGYLFFGEVPAVRTLLGAAIIILSSLMLTRERGQGPR